MTDFVAPELTLEAPIATAEDDGLGFDDYAQRLAALILKAQTPFTMAIEGAWGSGKSSMLNLIEAHLKASTVVIKVSVWELATQDEVWHAFVQAMFNQVSEQVPKQEQIDRRKVLVWVAQNSWSILLVIVPLIVAGLIQLNGGYIFLGTAALVVILWQTILYPALKAGAAAVKPFDLNDMLKTPSYKEQISLLTELRTKFAKLVDFALKTTKHDRIVVFIDDLDRCEPAQIPPVIEALKLFVTVQNCVYVIGVDRGIVAKALISERHLTTDDAHAYLDKVVQLWFPMPEFDVEKARRYVVKQLKAVDLPDDVKGIAPELFVELFRTPRRFKQAVNRYIALLAVREKENAPKVRELAVLQMFLIEQAIPTLYTFLKSYPGYTYSLWIHVCECYQYDRDWYTWAERDDEGELAPGFRSLSIWRGHLKGVSDDDAEDRTAPFAETRPNKLLTRDDVSAVTLIVSKSQKEEDTPTFPCEVHEWVDCVNLTLHDANLRQRLAQAKMIRRAVNSIKTDQGEKQKRIKALVGAEAKIETLARHLRGNNQLHVFNIVWLLEAYNWFGLLGAFGVLMRPRDLRGADLSHAQLVRAYLSEVQLAGADLTYAQLDKVNLSYAQLTGADLKSAQLTGADLKSAQLTGADLGYARLAGADLTYAQLDKANLSDARLAGADLTYAQLDKANLSYARLIGAFLWGAVLREAHLENATFDGKTVLPDAEIKRDEAGRALKDEDGNNIFDKYWTPDTDMSRYTNPEHPDFFLPEWFKEEIQSDKRSDA